MKETYILQILKKEDIRADPTVLYAIADANSRSILDVLLDTKSHFQKKRELKNLSECYIHHI
jgi:hypothetical protein